jgi:hypothetical protein
VVAALAGVVCMCGHVLRACVQSTHCVLACEQRCVRVPDPITSIQHSMSQATARNATSMPQACGGASANAPACHVHVHTRCSRVNCMHTQPSTLTQEWNRLQVIFIKESLRISRQHVMSANVD